MASSRTGLHALLVFALALAVRLLYIVVAKVYENPDITEVMRVAKTLAASGTFANPYLIATGPTAHVAPLYAGMLGLIYRIFGAGSTGMLMQAILCAVISACIYALIPLLARVLALPVMPAVAGAALGALLPIRMFFETKGSSEAACAALSLLAAVILTARTWQERHAGNWAAVAIAGVGWGMAFLAAPAAAPVCLGLLLLGLFTVRRYALSAVVILLVAGAVITPWTIRNHRTFGKLFFIRDNLGLELATGNSDHGVRSVEDGLSRRRWVHPSVDLQEATRMKRIGEIQYNRESMAESLTWIGNHRGEFASLTWQRFWAFWFPRTNHWAKVAIFALITAAAFVGLVRLWNYNRKAALTIAIIWVLYPAIYYFLLADIRYTYPIYWTFFFLAPFAFVRKSSRPLEY